MRLKMDSAALYNCVAPLTQSHNIFTEHTIRVTIQLNIKICSWREERYLDITTVLKKSVYD
jgi:hypothetical protein